MENAEFAKCPAVHHRHWRNRKIRSKRLNDSNSSRAVIWMWLSFVTSHLIVLRPMFGRSGKTTTTTKRKDTDWNILQNYTKRLIALLFFIRSNEGQGDGKRQSVVNCKLDEVNKTIQIQFIYLSSLHRAHRNRLCRCLHWRTMIFGGLRLDAMLLFTICRSERRTFSETMKCLQFVSHFRQNENHKNKMWIQFRKSA